MSHLKPFKEQMSSECRLKPTKLNLCHIVYILKILLYCLEFKYFILFFIILYLFYNLNILVQFNLLVKYFFMSIKLLINYVFY